MNAVKGTTFTANFPMFSNSYSKPKFVGHAKVSGIVTRDTCYDVNNKHWVWFTCTASDNAKYVVGKEYKKQGKNFYAQVESYQEPANYAEVAAAKDAYKAAYMVGNKAFGRA